MGLLLCLALVGCTEQGEEVAPDEIEQILGRREPPERKIISEIQDEDGRSPSRQEGKRSFVKVAARLREKDFLQQYIRGGHPEVSLGQMTVKNILTFTGPTQDDHPPSLLPREVMEIHKEALHMVQRCPRPGKLRILKDWEIFLVFKAAYDNLSQGERLEIIEAWKDRHGSDAPPAPEGEPFYPLFWLRQSELFWSIGGRFWWWAAHALMEDEHFEIDKKGRVIFALPNGKGVYSS